MNKAIRRWAVFACAAIVATALPGCGPHDPPRRLQDEWHAIDRVSVSPLTGKPELNPIAKVVVAEAIQAGIKPVIFGGTPAAQQAILDDLKNSGVITRDSQVLMITGRLPHDWARDAAPIIVFDTSDENRPLITGTRPTTNTIIHNTGKALGLTWEPVPQISIPGRGPRDLYTDGGDWMTTNEGRRLLTTTMLYENGGGHDPKVIRAVHDALADNFGITEVIALTPLDSRAVGYVMGNGHVDLQVRALPGGKVIVANVPAGDPQRPILEGNVRKLIEAGVPESKIIRVDNAAEGDGTKFFKTYTNALFLNKTVLIPMYGDTEADAAALAAYEQALNGSLPAQDKTRYRIVQVDGAESIQYSGVAHCAGRELPKTPRSPAGEMLASFRGTSMSFDAATGILSFTVGAIDFLGDAAEDVSSPAGNLDPLMGATIVAADLKLDPAMSSSDQFAFVGGNVTVRADGRDLFTASLPVLTVHGRWPSGSLDLCGALADIRLPAGDTSAWLVDFQRDVLGAPSGAPQFYVSSSTDLIDLSGEFTRSVGPVELDAMGICGSAPLLSPAAMSR